MEFEEKIQNLILSKREGSYWDFKREWYQNTADLLHDIICFANNLVNCNCYIIIGVDEENDYSLIDVRNDTNRKNTQKIIDFLKSKKFSNSVRPVAWVESIILDGKLIDVIVIQNTYETPYFLVEHYKGLFANNIYTRVIDTNTPKNMSADINHIEYLWKKRFRLMESPLERLKYILKDKDNWVCSPDDYADTRYYKFNPEFRIITEDPEDQRDGYEFYLFLQTDIRPHWYDVKVKYHQTLIVNVGGMALDGGRYFSTCPDSGFIHFKNYYSDNDTFLYKYYVENDISYLMHLLFYKEKNFEEVIAHDKLLECVLIFKSELEKEIFEQYVVDHKNEFMESVKKKKDIKINHQIAGYKMQVFEKELKTAYVLKEILDEFRIANKIY